MKEKYEGGILRPRSQKFRASAYRHTVFLQSGGLKSGSSHGVVTRPGATLETTLEQAMLFNSPIGVLDQGHQDASK